MTKAEIKEKIELAKKASRSLVFLTKTQRKKVLSDLAKELKANYETIIKANRKDIKTLGGGASESFVERLELDEVKIKQIADSVIEVSKLEDEIGKVEFTKKRPSGITIKKVRVPLGLVGMIFESRPNVIVDAFVLCFKSGNAVLLKGGKEISNTNKELVKLIKKVLKANKIDVNIIKDFSGIDRKLSQELLENSNIDCLIPRGGKGLIDFVKNNAKVPVIITGASVVHTYVHKDANLQVANRVILNAKGRRVSICNALDTILVHKILAEKVLSGLKNRLEELSMEIRADERSYEILKKFKYSKLKKAKKQDFDTEFLDYVLAVKIVDNEKEAIEHIQEHSLGHSEGIITKSKTLANLFFQSIDAACLYLNTSTQFSDGGEYGLGAEIGISTQKLHARGPFAHESLTTYKYITTSNGTIRG